MKRRDAGRHTFPPGHHLATQLLEKLPECTNIIGNQYLKLFVLFQGHVDFVPIVLQLEIVAPEVAEAEKFIEAAEGFIIDERRPYARNGQGHFMEQILVPLVPFELAPEKPGNTQKKGFDYRDGLRIT
jgi:hypothetical protein